MNWYVLVGLLSVLNLVVSIVALVIYIYKHGRGPPPEE